MSNDVLNVGVRNLLRLDEVKRWHTISVGREQTVAGHSYCVAVLVIEIAHRAGIVVTADFLAAALFHDAAEDVFGDTPSPAKTEHGRYVEPHFKLEPHFVGEARGWDLGTIHWQIIKLADVLESWMFLHGNAVGNHSTKCFDGLTERLRMLVLDMTVANSIDFEGMVSKLCVEVCGVSHLFVFGGDQQNVDRA